MNELNTNKNSTLSNGSDLTSDILNSFYCTIAVNLTSDLNPESNALRYLNDLRADTFYFYPTDVYEMKNTFAEVKNKNASGWDNISMEVISALPDVVLYVLVEAINQSFLVGHYPPSLKRARVIPLIKGGKTSLPFNYRPISLLPTLAKVVERLVRGRILHFVLKHKLSSTSQFGFQAGKNTNDAIFSFLENLYGKLNDGEVAAAVFCDLEKAFACLNHGILLEIYGFRGVASYLSSRYQSVFFNGDETQELSVTCVPKGSVLGPLLFLLYINDL